MKHTYVLLLCCMLVVISFMAFGCSMLSKKTAVATNYYVLDYLPATENKELMQSSPFPASLEIMETRLPRTYDRNQIVQKKSYTQISYFNNHLWANRLYDAVPNLLVRRLAAYNIFNRVSRDLSDTNPDYYLETVIHNIEYVRIDKPQAFLRMEFILRDADTQKVIFSNRNERTRLLRDRSMEYIVQSFNELIMADTDLFAAKCIDFLSGKQVQDTNTEVMLSTGKDIMSTDTEVEFNESVQFRNGQLLLPLLSITETPLPFTASYRDTAGIDEPLVYGMMNEVVTLPEGKWRVAFGPQNITADFMIAPGMRKVVEPYWSELIIKVIDESQTRVRMQYDIYSKSSGQEAFDTKVDFRYSPSEEIGEYDYLWLLKPGSYLVTLNGASPNALKDFTTVTLEDGKSYELTMVVNPEGDRSVLVGAGILASPETKGRLKYHKGAVHTNFSFSSSNSVDKDNPIRSISLSSQFDNKLDYDVWPFHLTMKSLYDLGFDKTTGTEFRINVDNYSMKNSAGFYPWKTSRFLKNLGIYGRGDVKTHFFDEYVFYADDTDVMKVSQDGDSLLIPGVRKFRVKEPFYPLNLKEGSGLTYRLNFTPKTGLNLRLGYGWQQNYENGAYSEVSQSSQPYKLYSENASSQDRGIEASVLFNANNIFKLVSINSSLDVLFPTDEGDKSTRYDNENLISFKIYRNISVDIKADIRYNRVLRDYVLLDYNAFLRLSLYY